MVWFWDKCLKVERRNENDTKKKRQAVHSDRYIMSVTFTSDVHDGRESYMCHSYYIRQTETQASIADDSDDDDGGGDDDNDDDHVITITDMVMDMMLTVIIMIIMIIMIIPGNDDDILILLHSPEI